MNTLQKLGQVPNNFSTFLLCLYVSKNSKPASVSVKVWRDVEYMRFFPYFAVRTSTLPWEPQTLRCRHTSSELLMILQSIMFRVMLCACTEACRDVGEKGEDFIMSIQIVVPTALKYSSEPHAFPARTINYSWVKLGLLNQLLGSQGHRCVCWMCTLIFVWAVPILGVQECSPGPLSCYTTDFAWCLPPALGCWPTQPHNSSQVRETCGCQMCWLLVISAHAQFLYCQESQICRTFARSFQICNNPVRAVV